MGAMQAELRAQEAAINALDSYIAEIRGAFGRKHGGKLDNEGTHALLDAAEEWSWGAPEGGHPRAEYVARLEALEAQVQAMNGAFFEAERRDHEDAQARLEEEAKGRRKEEEERRASGEDDDHDSRKLKFEDRWGRDT